MALTVTLDVYSGRMNPSWKLSAADAREFLDRVERIDAEIAAKPASLRGTLGYRGFHVSGSPSKKIGHLSMFTHAGILDVGQRSIAVFDAERGIEDWLLRTGRAHVKGALKKHVKEELSVEARPLAKVLPRSRGICLKCVAKDAPAYDPSTWNTPAHQPHNNCYNYANNQMTDTFAQPGRATGKPITSISCRGVQPSAESDGLRPSANFSTPLGAKKGWYVALVIWPNTDYHWYRQDDVGCWSHKPGQTAVRNVDNSGKKIKDPKTCDRGPYSVFCSYMITDKKVRIR